MIRLRRKILLHHLYAILFLGSCISGMSYIFVQKYIVGQAEEQIQNNLRTVRAVYHNRLDSMRLGFELFQPGQDLTVLKQNLGLDYLYQVPAADAAAVSSDIVHEALALGQPLGGSRVISGQDRVYADLARQEPLAISIRETPKARPTDRTELTDVLSLEFARPVMDAAGVKQAVLYGGMVINNNHRFIDEIADTVFEKKLYDGRMFGTVTVFQDDVRIATTVLDLKGKRAIGTRVSEEVYRKVVEQGGNWYNRAFVVTDWYLTAYEPIRDIRGKIIGILYVGILEAPFLDMRRNIFLVILMIVLLTSVLAVGFSVVLSDSLHRPLKDVLLTIRDISAGNFQSKVKNRSSIGELNELILSFNNMSEKLAQREASLHVANKKLADLNKDYLELVGFVSHELKGILSSIVINAYMLSNKVLGNINPEQEKTLKSMAKNLDYLTATVKTFLNLSRIEKGELKLNKKEVLLKEQILMEAVEAFALQAKEKHMDIIEDVPADVRVSADPELLAIVVNNLVSNAIKYGAPGGKVRISCRQDGQVTGLEVYNDGKPIATIDMDKLFKKFSRLLYEGMERVKGTGVGLFITKEIIERHGGTIWAKAGESGNTFAFQIPNH